jgi:probable F420-dependent oxidoreductase
MRAIWDTWYHGKPLDFRGKFYTHTLMTPMFTPTNTESGPPRVFLAAVGERMTEVAGEVADGLIAHAFTTRRYLDEVTLPAIARGLAKAGRPRTDFQITCPVFVVTGADEARFQASRTSVCKQIAFYGSTPAYRPVLELHGWGELQTELNRLSKLGRWDEMGTLIDDDMLAAFAVVEEPQRVVPALKARCNRAIDRVMMTVPAEVAGGARAALAALRG